MEAFYLLCWAGAVFVAIMILISPLIVIGCSGTIIKLHRSHLTQRLGEMKSHVAVDALLRGPPPAEKNAALKCLSQT